MIVGDSVEEIHIAREQNLISVAITGGASPKNVCAQRNRITSFIPCMS